MKVTEALRGTAELRILSIDTSEIETTVSVFELQHEICGAEADVNSVNLKHFLASPSLSCMFKLVSLSLSYSLE